MAKPCTCLAVGNPSGSGVAVSHFEDCPNRTALAAKSSEIVDVLGGYTKEKPAPIGDVFEGPYRVEFHPGISRVLGPRFYADVVGRTGSKNADVNATALLFSASRDLLNALRTLRREAVASIGNTSRLQLCKAITAADAAVQKATVRA